MELGTVDYVGFRYGRVVGIRYGGVGFRCHGIWVIMRGMGLYTVG